MSQTRLNAVYGTYAQKGEGDTPITEVGLKFVPLDLIAHWRRTGITADFLANFLSYNFLDQKTAHSVVSTLLNELLENAVKFSADKHKRIHLNICHFGDRMTVETMNSADEEQTRHFDGVIQKILSNDAEKLFLDQIQHTAENDTSASGLGLISMKKDFNAEYGVKIAPEKDSNHYEISVLVTLRAEDVEQNYGN